MPVHFKYPGFKGVMRPFRKVALRRGWIGPCLVRGTGGCAERLEREGRLPHLHFLIPSDVLCV